MRTYLFLLLSSFVFNITQSQEIADALRYSQENLNGTARFRAMGGAFGSLGGDLSSINVNPAGSAVFANNQITLTLTNFNTKNNSNYFGSNTTSSDNAFELNQTGAVFVFKNPYGEWKKFSFSVNYENTNNFDNSVFSAGLNPTNSVDDYFLSYAQGIPLSVLNDYEYSSLDYGGQQAFLGYQAYIINPVVDTRNNTGYVSNVRQGGNYYQQNSIYSNGYNGKLSFNMATSYKDRVFIGMNFNSHFTDYVKSTNFYESNNNPLDLNYEVENLTFTNNLHTYGSGFSFQIGTIAKITKEIRLGIAYESPTWYNLNDELSQSVVAVSSNSVEILPPDVVSPNVINIYPTYDLKTPGKLTGSFAYVFEKTGLISIDYGIKDYSNTRLQPESDIYFRSLNSKMSNILTYSNEVRIGGEYKIKALSLRGGYRFEESPYKDNKTIGDLRSFSGGFGYSFGAFKLDFAYTHAERSYQQSFFSQGFTDSAKINTINNNFTTTFLFEL